jgi:ribosomal protein L40E
MPGSSCGHENPPRAKFCLECGAALAVQCLHCHAELPPNAKFCLECGTRARPSAAPQAAPRAVEDERTPVGERRQLTVLFCDLVGSTPLAQQLDAEEWRDVVEAYHRTAAALTRFGGHVAQYLGDGLLIYFGWPTAHEDDPERAIRAGLAILDAMVPLNATLSGGTRLAVRIGMHTGPVVIGDGGAFESDYLFLFVHAQGRQTHIEMFELEDLDAALARFEELCAARAT